MEIVKANNGVMFGYWWRVETGADGAIKNISETFSSIRLGV